MTNHLISLTVISVTSSLECRVYRLAYSLYDLVKGSVINNGGNFFNKPSSKTSIGYFAVYRTNNATGVRILNNASNRTRVPTVVEII